MKARLLRILKRVIDLVLKQSGLDDDYILLNKNEIGRCFREYR